MRRRAGILTTPLAVPNEEGRVRVLKRIAATQAGMGEALTLDTLVGSVDAEVIATGPSGKGPNRGAILRHGPFTLWGFAGGAEDLTPAGEALLVNVVADAARQGARPVLETRRNATRDGLMTSLAYARLHPGYLRTMKRLYLPESLAEATLDEVEVWLRENRPYLRTTGRRFEVDEFARSLKIPNHRRALLERCISNLWRTHRHVESLATLRRYTGRDDLDLDATAWTEWFDENREYLHFSDCEGFRFKIDEAAKAAKTPSEKLRGWSSETVDYRPDAILDRSVPTPR